VPTGFVKSVCPSIRMEQLGCHFSCCLWDNVEKHSTGRQATDNNIIRHRKHARIQVPTHIIFNSYCYSMGTMVMRVSLTVTIYIHCLSCGIWDAASVPIIFFNTWVRFSFLIQM
jgi:hypothetical protein